MRVFMLAGVAAVALGIAAGARPAAVWGIYQGLYPSDPAKQLALDECSTQDQHFNRLDAAAREACYRHRSAAVAAAPASNFVDRWQASSRGHMPRNDIRIEQQALR
jgi:hypothetical protein